MRHATGQLTDRFHFLRLLKGLFGLTALRHFSFDPGFQPLIQLPELLFRPDAMANFTLKVARMFLEGIFGTPLLGDIGVNADPFGNST